MIGGLVDFSGFISRRGGLKKIKRETINRYQDSGTMATQHELTSLLSFFLFGYEYQDFGRFYKNFDYGLLSEQVVHFLYTEELDPTSVLGNVVRQLIEKPKNRAKSLSQQLLMRDFMRALKPLESVLLMWQIISGLIELISAAKNKKVVKKKKKKGEKRHHFCRCISHAGLRVVFEKLRKKKMMKRTVLPGVADIHLPSIINLHVLMKRMAKLPHIVVNSGFECDIVVDLKNYYQFCGTVRLGQLLNEQEVDDIQRLADDKGLIVISERESNTAGPSFSSS